MKVIVNDEVSRGAYGNQYLNLDRAVRLARARGVKLLHLVEDDTQFVWRNERLAAEVAAAFDAFPLAVQVSPLFWKFATKASGLPFPEHSAYLMRQPPGCGIGFVDVDRLAERCFQHQVDEEASTRHGAALGLELIALAHPVVARVPWPMYTRYRATRGRQANGTRPLLVKPLDEPSEHRLLGRDLADPPYAEHYCVPWGWRCWKPYAWTSSYRTWARTLFVVALHRRSIRGLVPRRAGDMK